MKFKKLLVAGLLGATLLSTPINTFAGLNTNIMEYGEEITLTEKNMKMLHGTITRKQYDDENYIIFVTCNSNQQFRKDRKYDGETYMVCVSRKWYRKHKKNEKVTVILYTNNTKSIKDDMIVNIRKGYWWENQPDGYRDDDLEINW